MSDYFQVMINSQFPYSRISMLHRAKLKAERLSGLILKSIGVYGIELKSENVDVGDGLS